jgi:hypothetical protein
MQHSPNLYSLAYISVATGAPDDAALVRLLEVARERNLRLGVTGMLVYCDQVFLQVLEGPRGAVEALFEAIRRDPRHTRVMVIHEGPVQERSFAGWSMGYRRLSPTQMPGVPGYSDFLDAESDLVAKFAASPAAAHRLLLSFRDCAAVVPDL